MLTKTRATEEQVAIVRRNLTEAFAALRKMGVAARANYLCCQGCAGAAMDDKYGKTAVGYVFWHNRDHARFIEGHNVYLAFGTFIKGADGKDVPLDSAVGTMVGHLICAVLKEHGVQTRWDGDIGTRIEVIVDPNEEA